MKRIFSIIMESGLSLPTGTIAFWGTLVPRILTVDYTFKLPYFANYIRHNSPGHLSQNVVNIETNCNRSFVAFFEFINICTMTKKSPNPEKIGNFFYGPFCEGTLKWLNYCYYSPKS